MDGSDTPADDVGDPSATLLAVVEAALEPLGSDWVERAAAVLPDLRAAVEARATAAAELLDGHGVEAVARVPKSRLADLQRCERSARARYLHPDDRGPGRAALRGVALDRFVLLAAQGSPLSAPTAELLSVLDAQGEEGLCDQVIEAVAEDLAVFDDLVDPTEAWRDLPDEWWPRLQSAATASLAGGRIVCSGRLDAELGGPLVGRPGVVVEVKSGAPRQAHVEEVALYALLVGWRDGVPPALVVRWYPFHGAAVAPVDAGSLSSAAARLGDAVETWAQLLVGRTPSESPGPWCRWCPDAPTCPSAAPVQVSVGAPTSAGGPAELPEDDEVEWEPPDDGVGS